jgi:hypothetical protein
MSDSWPALEWPGRIVTMLHNDVRRVSKCRLQVQGSGAPCPQLQWVQPSRQCHAAGFMAKWGEEVTRTAKDARFADPVTGKAGLKAIPRAGDPKGEGADAEGPKPQSLMLPVPVPAAAT